MLQIAQQLMGCAIGATDGEIGAVEDLYFDDQEWTIRYLVVAAGAWLNRRKVLISPRSLGRPDWDHKLLPAAITIEQVKSSPDIDTNKPVSRRHESAFLSHYRHPCYWEVAGPSAVGANPRVQQLDSEFGWSDEEFSKAVAARSRRSCSRPAAEHHLRSVNAVLKYSVRARDGDIGQIHGLLFADDDWAIRYIIVQTGHWWRGHQLLVAVHWITAVSWLDSYVSVDLSRHTLREAPVYDPAAPFDRSQEIELFKYFGRAGYWHANSKDSGS